MLASTICPVCQQESVIADDFPFCPFCGWDSFNSLGISNQDIILIDLSVRLQARKKWLDKLYEEKKYYSIAEEELVKVNEEIEKNKQRYRILIEEINSLRHSIQLLEHQCNTIKENEIFIDLKDEFLEQQEIHVTEIESLLNDEHIHFEVRVETNILSITLNHSLPNTFYLAIGFSKKPMRKIEDATLVLRTKLVSNDFQATIPKGGWQCTKIIDLSVLEEGSWHILFTPMQHFSYSKLGAYRIRVSSGTKIIKVQ